MDKEEVYSLEDNYGEILKKARQGKGLSIRSVSDHVGTHPQELLAVEAGRGEIFLKLADVLGLSYEKLLRVYRREYMPRKIPAKISEELLLKRFEVEVGGIVSNAYVLMRGHFGLFVDAVGASEEALEFAKEEGVEPRFLLITHGHFDHTAGAERVAKRYPQIKLFYAGRDMNEDARFETNGFFVQVFKTPGHTEDAVCYFVNDTIMFVGDTIFAGSVGRPNYSYEALLQNIKEKIFVLPDATILAPGHGPLTTVGEEKAHNPFF